jgi:deoxycytidylate deaminase
MEKTEKKIEYPYIPENGEILYVPIDNEFMREAEYLRNNKSTDLYFPTGAVVVKNGEIIGKGANQSLLRTKWLINVHKKWGCIRRWLNVPSGQKYWMCPGCSPSKQHAETRAVNNALKKGGIDGADLYLFGHWWCCKSCWGAMLNAGIKSVYLLENSEILFDKNNPNNIIGKR